MNQLATLPRPSGHQVGIVYLFAAFRCTCGKICAMGDQPNGNAAAVHQWPFCERYAALPPLQGAGLYVNQDYFASLGEPLVMTRELADELGRTCSPPEEQARCGPLPDPTCPECDQPLARLKIGRRAGWTCLQCGEDFFEEPRSGELGPPLPPIFGG